MINRILLPSFFSDRNVLSNKKIFLQDMLHPKFDNVTSPFTSLDRAKKKGQNHLYEIFQIHFLLHLVKANVLTERETGSFFF